MRRLTTDLAGLTLLQPGVFRDARGYFWEVFHRQRYAALGINEEFVQDNCSFSKKGVIRGLHFQLPPGQAKLVSVVQGRIWDVAVDLRPRSASFGRWEAFELDDTRHRQLFIPVGFAHGFAVLSEEARVLYKVSQPYDPRLERGLAWNDPEIRIRWPVREPIVSDRDARSPSLAELRPQLPDW